MEKNRALSVDQCQLQALQFSVHLINLLSVFLRCNGFTRIQKALVDQVGSRPSNSDHDLFLGESLALGSALELLLHPTISWLSLVITHNALFIACQSPIEKWFAVVA